MAVHALSVADARDGQWLQRINRLRVFELLGSKARELRSRALLALRRPWVIVVPTSCRSMDRMAPSEGADVGSTPAGRTCVS